MVRLTTCLLLASLYASAQTVSLEEIAIYGNTRTRTDVIRRDLKLIEGEVITEDILLSERAWLLRQDYFKRVEFQIRPGSTGDTRQLIMVVQEKGAWSVSPVLDSNDLFGWYAGAAVSRNNLWGSRNRITAGVQAGGIDRFFLALTNPGFRKPLFYTALRVEHEAFRYRYGDTPDPFPLRKTDAVFTIGRRLGRQFRVGVRAGLETIDVEDSGVTLSGNRYDDLILWEVFAEFDSRDWPLYPRSGFYLQSWFRQYTINREDALRLSGLDMRFYLPLFGDNIIALQSSIQISGGEVPVYKRFHVGGSKTIRGFRTGHFSGENCYVASLEYRFPIVYERNPLAGIHAGYAGVLFVDTGAAWFQNQTYDLSLLRGSAGIGIHVILDDWILRGEYGNRGKGWGFLIAGIGVKF